MKLNLFEAFEPENAIIILGERYSLVKRLSTNGLEQTFLAKDLHAPGHPDCIVSQFRVPEDHPSDPPVIRTLFQTEVKAFSKLKEHDCIPQLLAHFEVDGDFYIVWEKVEGHTLEEELASPVPWSDGQVVTLLNDLLSTLESIHQNRIVHSNLQPANLIRQHEGSRLTLVGFGAFQQASALVISPRPTTSTPPLFNTSPYMPDEQVAGHPYPSSDIYAVGLMAVQALTGQRPESIPTNPHTRELYWQSMASLSHPALLALLDRLVQPNFRARCQTASEALEALSALPPEITWFASDTEDSETEALAPVSTVPSVTLPVAPESTEALVSQPTVLPAQTLEVTQETAQTVRSPDREPPFPRKSALRRAVLPIGGAVLALLGIGALLFWRLPENRLVAEGDSQADKLSSRSSSLEVPLSAEESASTETPLPKVSESVAENQPSALSENSVAEDSVAEDSVAVAEETVEESRDTNNEFEGETSRQAFDGAEDVSSDEVAFDDTPSSDAEVAAEASRAMPLDEGPTSVLAPEAAKTTVIQFYNFVASRSWDSARSLLSKNMAERLEPDFFYQFQDVSVENMRVVNQTPELADLIVQNTYVYLDGSYQQEERNYTVQMINNQPTIVDTAFVEVIRDRNY